MKGGKEKEKGVGFHYQILLPMWGDRREEFNALVVVRSTTPMQFVRTMNS